MAIPETKKIHLGRNIERIRELRGIKQEALAQELGISQQAVSKMEQSESVDEERLTKVAEALGTSSGFIKSFNDEAINNFFGDQHNHEGSTNNVSGVSGNVYFPVDNLKEMYEKLLASEREKVQLLEGMVRILEGQLKR
jgi:transcriptional regulator with XRE-family HTH domain